MAAISTPGRVRAASACVSVIFPPPISPMYVVIWPAGAHSSDPSSPWNLPLSASSLLVSRPGATTHFVVTGRKPHGDSHLQRRDIPAGSKVQVDGFNITLKQMHKATREVSARTEGNGRP